VSPCVKSARRGPDCPEHPLDLYTRWAKQRIDEYSFLLYNRADGKERAVSESDGRVPTTFRLTPETRRLLVELARLLDKSQRAVIEEIVRQRAKREGVR
jgi:hypothetical protein